MTGRRQKGLDQATIERLALSTAFGEPQLTTFRTTLLATLGESQLTAQFAALGKALFSALFATFLTTLLATLLATLLQAEPSPFFGVLLAVVPLRHPHATFGVLFHCAYGDHLAHHLLVGIGL